MFCENCGKQLSDNARFCPFCGASVNGDVPAPAVKTQMQESASAAPMAPVAPNASALIYRTKCPSCGNVQDSRFVDTCKKCGTQHQVDTVNNGFLQIYRMGHFSGSIAGAAIYLDGEGMGHVANASSVLIELPPKTYNLHMAISTLRNCLDIPVTIEPGKTVCVKSQIKMGMIKNTIILHLVDPSEMPPLA